MSRNLIRFSSVVFSILLTIYFIIYCILFVGLNPDIYKKVQVDLEIADYAGTDQDTLDYATQGLIDYMNNERENIDMEGEVYNVKTQLFNDKEKKHMVDVKDLMNMAKTVKKVIFALLILILIFAISSNQRDFKKYFFKWSAISLVSIIGLMAIFTIVIVLDFTAFWMAFHKVFFTNDLYLLNPLTDFLIRMMPERFFIEIVKQIVVRFLLIDAGTIVFMLLTHQMVGKEGN